MTRFESKLIYRYSKLLRKCEKDDLTPFTRIKSGRVLRNAFLRLVSWICCFGYVLWAGIVIAMLIATISEWVTK